MGLGDFLKDPLGTGGLGDLFGGSGGNPAKQANKAYSKYLAPFFDAAKSESDYLFSAAQGAQKDVLGVLDEGFGNAKANVGQQQRVATQGILDSQSQALASNQQAAVSSGMVGSTGQAMGTRGIASDTARALANLNSQVGSIYAGLDVGEAQAKAGAIGGLSNLYQNQAGAALNFLGLQFSGINQTPVMGPQDSPLAGLLGGALQAAPFFI